MDGVIVDSAEAHNASWQAMAEEFDVPYDPEKDFKAIFGRRNEDIIRSSWGITDPDEITRMELSKENNFRQAAVHLEALPGVVELVAALAEAGWKQAICSSAPLENVHILLKSTSLTDYMEAIVSAEDVSQGKPNPQVFLLGFKRLGVEPANGVVIEDAPAGVQAGKAAGATTIAITNTQSREILTEAGADCILDTLSGVTPKDLKNLIESRKP